MISLFSARVQTAKNRKEALSAKKILQKLEADNMVLAASIPTKPVIKKKNHIAVQIESDDPESDSDDDDCDSH
jgi:hypothetical protein